MNDFIKLLLCGLLSYIFCNFIIKKYIQICKQKELRQYIRKDIVITHQTKKGTPTMGGLVIIVSTLLSFIIFNPKFYLDNKTLSLVFIFIFYGIIGLMDDLFKIIYKNSDGISGLIRLFLEIVGCIVSIFLMVNNNISTVNIPFYDSFISLGVFVVIFYIFVIVGSANAYNFTDGLDGLASGLMISSLLPFLLIALNQKSYEISFFIMALIGSLIGFLRYNFPPAKIFMGDVGSLSVGGVFAMISIALNNEVLILISGLIYIIEILSVIIQVVYFKLTNGKRIFLMAPLHHHFEKKGWSETKVIMIFWISGFVLALITSMIGVMQ